MTTNRNIGATVPSTNAEVGADNPGAQDCPLCRQHVTPRPIGGLRQYAEPSGAPNSGKAAAVPTSAGYACPACGHNFNWVKSTGKAGGPSIVGNTNQVSAADM